MNKEKKNQYILVFTVVGLLIVVLGISIFLLIQNKQNKKDEIIVKFNQLYVSDYELNILNNNYYYGTRNNNLALIIDNNGKEIFKSDIEIPIDAIYPTKNGNYLIYSNQKNIFKTYIFDGTQLKELYTIENISYVKPIIYKNDNMEYIVGFTTNKEDKLYLYNLENNNEIIIDNVSLIADSFKDNIYYTYNDNYIIVQNSEEKMGVIDLSGKKIIDYKYNEISNTHDNTFIVKNNKYYGVIDKEDKKIIKISYKAIANYNEYYLVVDTKDKMALYNKEKNLTGFKMKYDNTINFSLRNTNNSIKLYKNGDYIAVVNNYLEDTNKTEYDLHNLYIIKDNKIEKNIEQINFKITDSIIYSYDKEYNVSIYDDSFKIVNSFKIEESKKINKINYINSELIKVEYLKDDQISTNKYFDLEGNESSSYDGELIYKDKNLAYYIKTNDKEKALAITDSNGKVLNSIKGNSIIVNGEYIIIDNAIYKINIVK